MYEQLKQRMTEQNIDYANKHILIDCGSHCLLDDYYVGRMTLSKDENWLCIAVPDEEANATFGENCYEPICYEIAESMNTMLRNDHMWYRVNFYLLEKRN